MCDNKLEKAAETAVIELPFKTDCFTCLSQRNEIMKLFKMQVI